MGVLFIIFGTRGITSNAGEGQFHCPACGPQPYKHKRVRRFFTLYFIPLIPLDVLGEYVECGRCTGTYKPEVLDLDPGKGGEEFEAEFHKAIKRIMVLMCLADGVVDDEEIATIREIFGSLTETSISEENVRHEIDRAGADGRSATAFLSEIVGTINDNGKELVVKAAFMVAAADGVFQEEEKVLLSEIGEALQMTDAHFNGVLQSMVGDE